jgi:hypothetical protein
LIEKEGIPMFVVVGLGLARSSQHVCEREKAKERTKEREKEERREREREREATTPNIGAMFSLDQRTLGCTLASQAP